MSHVHYFQCDGCGKRYKPDEVLENSISSRYRKDSPLCMVRVPVTRCLKSGERRQEIRAFDLCSECRGKFYTAVDNYFAHIEVLDDGNIFIYPGRMCDE